MSEMKYEKKYHRSVKKNAAFYVSLAVCLAAVGGAAWTTYGNIREYSTDLTEESSIPSPQDTRVDHELSNQKYETPEPSQPQESAAEKPKESSVKAPEARTPETVPVQPVITEQEPAARNSAPIEGGEIIKRFSLKDPLHSATMNDWRTHGGLDIAAPAGAAVHAMMDGQIKRIYTDPLLGQVVSVEHTGGYEALYCGVTAECPVKQGDQVKTGDTIGFVGKIPSELKDESHLHLEVKYQETLTDPSTLF